jgi:hypothetical protein
LKEIVQKAPDGSGASAKLACPLCCQGLWKTENGLAAHVWHDHVESIICMGHGKASLKYGDPAADPCSRSAMALCSLRLARQGQYRKVAEVDRPANALALAL